MEQSSIIFSYCIIVICWIMCDIGKARSVVDDYTSNNLVGLGDFHRKTQNNYIDTIGFKNHRATMLSAFSFFADVFEVVFLLANSYISSLNYKYIFVFIAASLLLSDIMLRNDNAVKSVS